VGARTCPSRAGASNPVLEHAWEVLRPGCRIRNNLLICLEVSSELPPIMSTPSGRGVARLASVRKSGLVSIDNDSYWATISTSCTSASATLLPIEASAKSSFAAPARCPTCNVSCRSAAAAAGARTPPSRWSRNASAHATRTSKRAPNRSKRDQRELLASAFGSGNAVITGKFAHRA